MMLYSGLMLARWHQFRFKFGDLYYQDRFDPDIIHDMSSDKR